MAENGTASIPVSLRVTAGKDPSEDAQDLARKIGLINSQRDGFRNVRQTDLIAEIAAGEIEVDEETSSDEDVQANEKRGMIESIPPKRFQMQRSMNDARMTALMGVDSLSIAASSVSKHGWQTASPLVKQELPEASMTVSRRDAEPPGLADRERQKNQIWMGSFMTNNTDSADAMLAAATRLEGLVKAETEYWGQLLSLTSNGWPVYKPQAPNAPLYVRFVASEAGPNFKAQGSAPLKPNSEGKIRLDRRVGSEPRTLRLRLSRRGSVVATSVPSSLSSLAELGSSVEDKVRKEQNSLFEEELFQEMAMESRELLPQGVRLRNNVLHIPVPKLETESEPEYLVDLISIDEANELLTHGAADEKTSYQDLLDTQAVFLRLLLCRTYHERAQRRSKPPKALSDRDRRDPPARLIRPFLNFAVNGIIESHKPATANSGIRMPQVDSKRANLTDLSISAMLKVFEESNSSA